MVFSGNRQIDQSSVLPAFIGFPRVPCHDIGIHIDGINGVGNGNAVAVAKNIEDIPCVALGAVGNKNFTGINVAAAGLEVVGGNFFP